MRKMKDSGVEWIGEIPEEWECTRLKFTFDDSNVGESVDKEFYSSDTEGYVFYTAGANPVGTSYTEFPEWKYTSYNDILLARNGTPYVYLPSEGAVYSDHIIRIGIKNGYDKRFIRYCLQRSIEAVVVETVSIATWSISLWKEQNIPLPSYENQKRIAEYLDSKCSKIDAIIARQEEIIEKLKEYKLSVITEAVTKGLDPDVEMKDSGVKWLSDIPVHWKTYRIANLYDQTSEAGLEELPILTVSINTGISDRELADDEKDRVFVRSEDRTKYKRVRPGDLAYNMMRAWQGAFGAVRVDGMVSPAYVTCRPKAEAKIDSRYIEYLFRTPIAIEEMHRYSHGIADFRLRLYWPEFKNIRLCLPPIEEQKEIADFIDKKSMMIDATIEQRERAVAKLQEYKKSLIYEVVTGKKEVL